MSIDIKIGNIYRTETDQLRQVTDIATDDDGFTKVTKDYFADKIKKISLSKCL